MNKTAINKFSVWARRKLIGDITYKAGLLGISESGILQPLPSSTKDLQFFDIGTGKPTEIIGNEIKQRDALIKRIRDKESASDYKSAFQFVVEEVAYTWFNRLIAIRFMEVNGYLPSRVRVLSSEISGKIEPDMVTKPFETDMEFTAYETDKIMQLKDENKLDELFRMLFIKQCNKFNEVLPELFEKTADYTEILLNISFTDAEGIVNHLINDIVEKDFTEAVEIIGWMYQYYNTEPKDEVFSLLKKNVKITKERIPAATQLFTPDWIVKYMVENSLGRLWLEGHPNESLKSELKYYLDEAEQVKSVKIELETIRDTNKEIKPEEIKIIDPCMGSGHILVYAFDVLMKIYESIGYTQQDAANSIVENNLYGVDIDDRAFQLAYFAVLMKARKYDRRFLTKGISPKLYSIKESNNIKENHFDCLGNSIEPKLRNEAIRQLKNLLITYQDAKEYGSILNIDYCDIELINQFIYDFNMNGQITFDNVGAEQSQEELKKIIAISEALTQKYDVVVTNPPYMGSNGMSLKLSKYVKDNYPNTKADMSTVFMEKSFIFAKHYGYISMINIPVWMSLAGCETFRKEMICNKTLINMVHNGRGIFGSDFGSTSFVFKNQYIDDYIGVYKRLFIKQGAVDSVEQKEKWFFDGIGEFKACQKNYLKIPSASFSYQISENVYNIFEKNKKIGDYGKAKQGLITGNNDKFLRCWFEISKLSFSEKCFSRTDTLGNGIKWYPYNKGGDFRKWYGNNQYVVNWENDGFEIRSHKDTSGKLLSRPQNLSYYFKQGLTWTALTAGKFSVRFSPEGFMFDAMGPICFMDSKHDEFYVLGFLNSVIGEMIMRILCPNLKFDQKPLENVPLIFSNKERIDEIVSECIEISKCDWDSFETSWDFATHPLIMFSRTTYSSDMPLRLVNLRIEDTYINWKKKVEEQIDQLKSKQEELNHIFIDIYGLNNEVSAEVEYKDISLKTNPEYRYKKKAIKEDENDLEEEYTENLGISNLKFQHDTLCEFIMYAVGCILGRYSIDVDGLVYAGGEWDDSKYSTFIPDADNCIPITDEEYFEDDIVGLFVVFVKRVFGEGRLEENLEFIARVLGNKGNSSREIIRSYFVKDFYKDHMKIYQKRPIYWLYDSGKNDGFKALVYMHRYNEDTTGIVRVDYLHKIQKIYLSEIDRMHEMVDNSSNAREVSLAEKRIEKLVKQLKETKEYDERIAHLALSRITIDLDDGVNVNYEKVQTSQDGKKLDILAKI